RRRHTRFSRDWSSDVCSSDLAVVVREGRQVTAEELREFLADKVAKWQLPENWTFVEEVPKTSVGKFDKKRLRSAHADGKLDVIRSEERRVGKERRQRRERRPQ